MIESTIGNPGKAVEMLAAAEPYELGQTYAVGKAPIRTSRY
jgi:hypothetical protein